IVGSTVCLRHIGVGRRAGLLSIRQRHLAEARAIQTHHTSEQSGVHSAVVGGTNRSTGRISVDA
ncbi:hypothetical protein K4A07_18110, partial [Lactiplantibacillus plantarum]|nr:hypothetical protein [Lactiplantibacillus plantarum]